MRNTLLGLGFVFGVSPMLHSCYKDTFEPQIPQENTNSGYYGGTLDEVILPDTVSQPTLQQMVGIHEKIDAVFHSLNIIDKDKSLSDVESIEFEDIDNNIYKYDLIKQTEKGFEFSGTVNQNGVENFSVLKLSDAESIIHRPIIFVESSTNKKHNLSTIYQNRWRKGIDGTPERRLFQNRVNQELDSINGKDYYPYDIDNVFSLRMRNNSITSKAFVSGREPFSDDDEFKNIKVVYKK